MKCTNVQNGAECGADLTIDHGLARQRGVMVRLMECTNGCRRQLQFTDGGAVIQTTTHRTPFGRKRGAGIRAYDWQRDMIKRMGHTEQSYWDAKCLQDAQLLDIQRD